jgi:hypothetical protein
MDDTYEGQQEAFEEHAIKKRRKLTGDERISRK